jgi:hypothetical protein
MVAFGFMSIFILKSVNELLPFFHQESIRPVTNLSELQWDSLPIWLQQLKSEHCFDYPVNFLHCSNLRQGQPCSDYTVAFAPALRNLRGILDPIEL